MSVVCVGNVVAPQMNVINFADGVPVFVEDNQVFLYCKSSAGYFKLYLVPEKEDAFTKAMMAKLATNAAASNEKPEELDTDAAAADKKPEELATDAAAANEKPEVSCGVDDSKNELA